MKKTCLRIGGTGLLAGILCGGAMSSPLMAQKVVPTADTLGPPLMLDASAPFVAAGPADYDGGTNRNPNGSVLGVTTRYLTLNGKPWIPVMGEMHFSRVPEAEWDDELLKMKTAGVNVVSTYIIWNHHEEVQGQWDWKGQRDLRHFAELCARHGLLFYPRIGPWAHAEVRNGGFPDWVVKAGPVRELDPTFMAETKAYFDQIGEQLHGLLWKDGGPVIGVQIENEYAGRGPGKGDAYILALKKLALSSGMDVPLYTVTGWDHAVVPPRAVLPVYGGYPSAPWDGSRTKLAPEEVYAFRFGGRVSGNMGMVSAAPGTAGQADAQKPQTPFLTAEEGGGNQDTYHRRPVLDADDIAAMMPVMLGSGVNLYGTYMFHGGQNPEGKLTTLEESQASGSATDVPVKSYDFQAPIGEYGLERASLRLIKNWNYFMQDFGSILAPMPVFAPAIVPQSPADLGVVRWSVRTDGKAGFLFVNNYVRQQAMPERRHVQFVVELPAHRRTVIPAMPLDIPSGAYFAWPFGLDVAGVPIRYATAQVIGRTTVDGDELVSLGCTRGVRCEVALEGAGWKIALPAGVTRTERESSTILTWQRPAAGEHVALSVKRPDGQGSVQLVLLSPSAAEKTWMVPLDGATRLLETIADVSAGDGTVTLRQLGEAKFKFAVLPKLASAPTSSVKLKADALGGFAAVLEPFHEAVLVKQSKSAGKAPVVKLGPPLSWRPAGVAEAAGEATWAADAAQWLLQVQPVELPTGVSALFLCVDYAGDEARLLTNGTLLDDDFYNGMPWVVGLKRYREAGALPALTLSILPIRADAPIYLEDAARAAIDPSGQTAILKGVSIIPQYQLQLRSAARP